MSRNLSKLHDVVAVQDGKIAELASLMDVQERLLVVFSPFFATLFSFSSHLSISQAHNMQRWDAFIQKGRAAVAKAADATAAPGGGETAMAEDVEEDVGGATGGVRRALV